MLRLKEFSGPACHQFINDLAKKLKITPNEICKRAGIEGSLYHKWGHGTTPTMRVWDKVYQIAIDENIEVRLK